MNQRKSLSFPNRNRIKKAKTIIPSSRPNRDFPVQRLATTSEEEKVSSNDERMERDKEKPFQRKPAEQEKEKEKTIQKKDDPLKGQRKSRTEEG